MFLFLRTLYFSSTVTNILVRFLTVNLNNCLAPNKSENVRPHSSNSIEKGDPIIVSQSSRENATPSSGTSPLASYKEVSPPGN